MSTQCAVSLFTSIYFIIVLLLYHSQVNAKHLLLFPNQTGSYNIGDHIKLKCSYEVPKETSSLQVRFVKETVNPIFSRADLIEPVNSVEEEYDEVLILEATSDQLLKAQDHGATIYCDLVRDDQIVDREETVINVTAPPEVLSKSIQKKDEAQHVFLQVLSNPPIDGVDVFRITDENDEEEVPTTFYNISLVEITGAFVNVEINSTGLMENPFAVYIKNNKGTAKFVYPDSNTPEIIDRSNSTEVKASPRLVEDVANSDSLLNPDDIKKPTKTYLTGLDKELILECFAPEDTDVVVWMTSQKMMLECSMDECKGACKSIPECGYHLVHYNNNPMSFSLVIESVMMEDYGSWACQSKTEPPIVHVNGIVLAERPYLRITNEEKGGFVSGQVIEYSCKYESVLPTNLFWNKTPDLVSRKFENTPPPRENQEYKVESSHVLQTTDDDFGMYITCEVLFSRHWNISNRVIASKRVEIKVPPKLWPTNNSTIVSPSKYERSIKIMAYPFPTKDNITVYMKGGVELNMIESIRIAKTTDHMGEIELSFPTIPRQWEVVIRNAVGELRAEIEIEDDTSYDLVSTWWFWTAIFVPIIAIITMAVLIYRKKRNTRKRKHKDDDVYMRYSDYRYTET